LEKIMAARRQGEVSKKVVILGAFVALFFLLSLLTGDPEFVFSVTLGLAMYLGMFVSSLLLVALVWPLGLVPGSLSFLPWAVFIVLCALLQILRLIKRRSAGSSVIIPAYSAASVIAALLWLYFLPFDGRLVDEIPKTTVTVNDLRNVKAAAMMLGIN